MAVLPLVKYGDPLLRQKLQPITEPRQVQELVDDMFETMYAESGIGLAANQVGWDLNFAVIDVGQQEEGEEPRVIVQPEIIEKRGTFEMEEGCLSIPGIRATITRFEAVVVRYRDEHGKDHEECFEGLLGRVIQHEVDHLNGVFFTDHLTPTKHVLLNKRLAEIVENGQPSTTLVL